MKQLKETVGACSVLALGRSSPIPQSSYSPEEIQRKFMTYYNPDNININYPENQFIESLSMTNENYFYYPPPFFAFDAPATTPITTSTVTTTTTTNNTNNNNLSPISPPESCSNLNDLTDTFTSTSHPSDFTNTSNNDHHHHHHHHHHHQHPSSLPIKLESSRCPLDHDYNIALSLTKDLSINSLSSYSPTGTPMLSPLTDCFSLHNVAEPYVNILSPTPDSIISEEKFTSNQSQNDDHHQQIFDLDNFTFDPRDYFNFESFVSDAVRRKSLDDAIFLRRISSTTPIKSEISFQQQLNRRRSLPSEFTQQRLQIEDDFSEMAAMSTSSSSSLSPLLPSSSSSSSSSTIPTPASTSTPQKSTKTKQPRKSSKSLAPFACPHEHCSKTFTRQYNLKSHLRTHTDERPFICNYPGCPRAFARQHDLKRHQKLHLGLKPHVCSNCGRAFARLDALNRHLRSDNAAQCAQVTMANNNNSSIGKLFKSSNI